MIFYSFYGRTDTALALEHIALSMGEETRPTPAEAALRALAGKRALLILDGAEQADHLAAVLAVRGGCGVLITSRARRDAVAEWEQVTPLPLPEAVELLVKWGGTRAAENAAARRICELVGGLPLAVRLAGRYLARRDEMAADYLAWLEETPLAALGHGRRPAESVPLLLERSVAQVSQGAQQALAVVGMLALAPFDRAVAAAGLGRETAESGRLLGELLEYGLLLREGTLYQVSHPLVHRYAYARERVEAAGAGQRLAGYYDVLVREEREKGPEGFRRLDEERPHLMRVLAGCLAEENWEAACRLVWAMEDYLDLCGFWAERRIALEYGVQAAQQSGRRYDEGAFVGNLGNAYSDLGEVQRAIEYYQQALAIAREIGDRRGEGIHAWNLGLSYEESDPAQAVVLMSVLVAYEREIGHPDAEKDAARVAEIEARLT